MKKHLISCITLPVLLIFSACIPSIHPLYTQDTLIFEQALLGLWQQDPNSGNRETWIFKKGAGKMYHLTHIDGNGRVGGIEAGMVRLGGDLFLDFYPGSDEKEVSLTLEEFKVSGKGEMPCEINDMVTYHLYPMHTFARIELSDNKLTINMLGSDWLQTMFAERKIRIKHEQGGKDDFVLTASSEELQKFITKYGNEERAYVDPIVLMR